MGMRKEEHRGKMPFLTHYIKSVCYQYDISAVTLTLTAWRAAVFARFLHREVAVLPVPTSLRAQHTVKGLRVKLQLLEGLST